MTKNQALLAAVCWTIAVGCFGIALLFRDASTPGILTVVTFILSMINMIINWIAYGKKRQEEEHHE